MSLVTNFYSTESRSTQTDKAHAAIRALMAIAPDVLADISLAYGERSIESEDRTGARWARLISDAVEGVRLANVLIEGD